MLKYTTDIMYLKGVGPSRAVALKNNGIETINDLLYFFPRKYLDRTNVKLIKNLTIGEQVAVIGTVINLTLIPIRRGKIFQLTLSDETGIIKCMWFNSISWISEKFEVGNRVAIFGKIEFSKGIQITHPEFDILDSNSDVMNTGVILPIYSSSNNMKKVGIDSRGVRRLGAASLDLCFVAMGRFDGFYEFSLYPWDICAGILIVTESGGNVTDWNGNKCPDDGCRILATNGNIHSDMINILINKDYEVFY